jgi:hypothetical protein
MKLTWFGGTTVRIHIGGVIIVIDARSAPKGIDSSELVSGADTVIADFGRHLDAVDPIGWRPRKAPSVLEEADFDPAVNAWKIDSVGILIDAVGESPLLLTTEYEMPDLGRWAEKAVVVLLGTGFRVRAENLIDAAAPRLIALGGSEADIDEAFEALSGRDFGVGLISLEAGLAVEV